MYSRVYRRDRVARSAASWICCPSWVWLSSSTEAACASGYRSARACTNVFLHVDSSDRSSSCDHCSRRPWYVCAPPSHQAPTVTVSPVVGGGEKIVGGNPSLGVAIGDEKRVNMGGSGRFLEALGFCRLPTSHCRPPLLCHGPFYWRILRQYETSFPWNWTMCSAGI